MSETYAYQKIDANILVNHFRTESEYHDTFHIHNNYEIYYFMDGEIDFFVNKSCYRMKKGNLLFFNTQDVHKAVNLASNVPYERFVIQFNPGIIRKLGTEKTNLLACFEDAREHNANIITLDLKQREQYEAAAEQLLRAVNGGGFGSDILPYAFLTQLLVLINEVYFSNSQLETSIMSPQISATLEYIDSHLTEDLSLDSISDALAISKYHLSHVFKKNTGTTIYQYVLVKRIALSKTLLREGRSVTEACHGSGFNDYANFIRTFKNVTGMSPGSFGSGA